MKIVILLYEGFTALDAIGPYEVLSRLPGADVTFAAARAGVVTSDTGFLKITATRGIDEITLADIVLVPGGPGDTEVMRHEPTLEWLRRMHEQTTWTTSVCTGSLILAAAGLLKGVRATTHWAVADYFRQRFPKVDWQPQLCVTEDRGVLCGGGPSHRERRKAESD